MNQGEKEQDYEGSIVVKNRDIPVLANLKYIMVEIQYIEERRLWEYTRVTNITQHLSGMPHGSGNGQKTEDAIIRMMDIEQEHAQKCQEYVSQIKAAKRIINSIQTQSMRTFVNMRYVMGISDVEIRRQIGMSKRGFYRARDAVETAPSMADVRWPEKYILQ